MTVPESDKRDRLFVTALARGLDVLQCFGASASSLGNAELSARCGLPKATVSRLTHTLIELGYLEREAAEGKYRLGPAVLSLGYAYLSGQDIRERARPLMRQLAEATETTVVLGARDRDRMVVLELAQGHPMFRLNLEVGTRVPPNLTALGRARFCALPKPAADRWLAELESQHSGPNWPRTRRGILKAIADYQSSGFCYSLGDWYKDMYAVGVPLITSPGQAPLALSVSGPLLDIDRKRIVEQIGPELRRLAASLARQNGQN